MEFYGLFVMTTAILATSSLPINNQQEEPRPSGRKVMLILLDGLRWDYPDFPGLTGIPRLAKLGVKASYLIPEYPTNTFPNIFTLSTGLHVESHGIIDNNIYDPETGKLFAHRNQHYNDPLWWENVEPFWITAKKQGLRTHLYHWIGCEVTFSGIKPDHCIPYPPGHVEVSSFLASMYESLDLIQTNQTDLVALYTDYTDHVGHFYAAFSDRYNASIRQLDDVVNRLVDELQTRNLTETVDVIVVSDHGVRNANRDRLIYLTDYVSTWQWYTTDMKVLVSQCSTVFLWPKRQQQIMTLYGQLAHKHPHLRAFLKQHYSDVPNWYFGNNKRAPPITLVADSGWCIVRPFDYIPYTGTHGYDNNEPDMRAMFMAFGPDFKEDYQTGPINAVDVYQIYSRILGIQQTPNNGTWSHVSDMMTWGSDVTNGGRGI